MEFDINQARATAMDQALRFAELHFKSLGRPVGKDDLFELANDIFTFVWKGPEAKAEKK